MPTRPPRYRPTKARPPKQRPSPALRGYDGRWRRASKAFLRAHPLCVRCEAEGRLTGATVVDHVVPHKGDPDLFWNQGNWQSLCKRHHDRKTATEDGGLGRPARPRFPGGGAQQ